MNKQVLGGLRAGSAFVCAISVWVSSSALVSPFAVAGNFSEFADGVHHAWYCPDWIVAQARIPEKLPEDFEGRLRLAWENWERNHIALLGVGSSEFPSRIPAVQFADFLNSFEARFLLGVLAVEVDLLDEMGMQWTEQGFVAIHPRKIIDTETLLARLAGDFAGAGK